MDLSSEEQETLRRWYNESQDEVRGLRSALADAFGATQNARNALDAAEQRAERAEGERDRLREIVRLADAVYVAAHDQAQERSDKEYMAEFGIKGPSLAGFLPGGADRDYHYARHTAGECPLPSHIALAALETDQ